MLVYNLTCHPYASLSVLFLQMIKSKPYDWMADYFSFWNPNFWLFLWLGRPRQWIQYVIEPEYPEDADPDLLDLLRKVRMQWPHKKSSQSAKCFRNVVCILLQNSETSEATFCLMIKYARRWRQPVTWPWNKSCDITPPIRKYYLQHYAENTQHSTFTRM